MLNNNKNNQQNEKITLEINETANDIFLILHAANYVIFTNRCKLKQKLLSQIISEFSPI
jgi:hypothetical protein